MTKLATLIFFAFFLIACGGENSSSFNESSHLKAAEVAKNVEIIQGNITSTFIKIGNNNWEKIPSGNYIFDQQDAGKQSISILSVCDTPETYYLNIDYFYSNANKVINHGDCNAAVASNAADILPIETFRIINFLMTDVYQRTYQRVFLTSSSKPRSLLAIGQNIKTGKYYFFRRDGINLSPQQTYIIDFNNIKYSKEVALISSPIKDNFTFTPYYCFNAESDCMYLNTGFNNNSPYVLLPENFQSESGFYTSEWHFGDNSSYEVSSKHLSTSTDFNISTDEMSKDILSYTGNENEISIQVLNNRSGLPLSGFSIWFNQMNTNSKNVHAIYNIEKTRLATNNFSVELVDFTTIPDLNLQIEHPTIENTQYKFAIYAADEYSTTKNSSTLLQISSKF
jgi:hypothetical protein